MSHERYAYRKAVKVEDPNVTRVRQMKTLNGNNNSIL